MGLGLSLAKMVRLVALTGVGPAKREVEELLLLNLDWFRQLLSGTADLANQPGACGS